VPVQNLNNLDRPMHPRDKKMAWDESEDEVINLSKLVAAALGESRRMCRCMLRS